MSKFIGENLIPVKVHIKEQPATFKRFEALWTPTLILLDPEGRERYRFVGYLPPNEFLAHLALGLGKVAFAHLDWKTAERWFREVAERYPETEVAPEALYWEGVCRYKATNDHVRLVETAQQFLHRYQQSSWAKRASAWLPKAA